MLLTAPDGYQATRSYSAASSEPGRDVLRVDELADGEVSPFVVREVRAGDQLEVHGPLGSYFLWQPARAAVRSS
jgi:ferredoxin-NADP reductase